MDNLKYSRFFANGFTKNSIFDLNHSWNRDNCFYPYNALKEKFRQYGIDINTQDIEVSQSYLFGIDIDFQKTLSINPSYLLMLETHQAYPPNRKILNEKKYRKVFTWNDELVDGEYFFKINLPNKLNIHLPDGFYNRDKFCCLIAGNKTLASNDKRNLYIERIKLIRWFEKNAPSEFYLYGADWDLPAIGSGTFGKLTRKFFKYIKFFNIVRPFPSYLGFVKNKKDILIRTRFSICYENIRDLPGYITEKIFDSFFAGCVPVYWGAANVKDYIPEDCFIDRRSFEDTKSLYEFLHSITEDEYICYQQRIAAFLQSTSAYEFSSDCFVETVVSNIINDLKGLGLFNVQSMKN